MHTRIIAAYPPGPGACGSTLRPELGDNRRRLERSQTSAVQASASAWKDFKAALRAPEAIAEPFSTPSYPISPHQIPTSIPQFSGRRLEATGCRASCPTVIGARLVDKHHRAPATYPAQNCSGVICARKKKYRAERIATKNRWNRTSRWISRTGVRVQTVRGTESTCTAAAGVSRLVDPTRGGTRARL